MPNLPIQSKRRLPRRSRRGLTLVETILYFVVAAVVLAGVLVLFQSAEGQNDELVMERNIPLITGGLRDTFPNARTYPDGDLIPTMAANKQVPGELASTAADGTPTMTSPYGNNITVVGSSGAAVITVVGMDDEDCTTTLSKLTDRTASQSGFAAVSAGGDALSLPFTSAQLAAACDAGAGANDVVLTLR